MISTIVSLFLLIAQEYPYFLWIFLTVFFATCLTTIALLQCKIYSLPWITHEYHDFLSIFLNIFLITCLMTIIAFLQCKIYYVVRRHRFQIHSQQMQGRGQTQDEMRTTFERHKPSARGEFHIYLILLICYFPKIFTEFAMTGMKSEEIFLIILEESTTTLMFVNSCLNPLIYCWKLRHIRRTIKMTLRNVYSGARCCGN